MRALPSLARLLGTIVMRNVDLATAMPVWQVKIPYAMISTLR